MDQRDEMGQREHTDTPHYGRFYGCWMGEHFDGQDYPLPGWAVVYEDDTEGHMGRVVLDNTGQAQWHETRPEADAAARAYAAGAQPAFIHRDFILFEVR